MFCYRFKELLVPLKVRTAFIGNVLKNNKLIGDGCIGRRWHDKLNKNLNAMLILCAPVNGVFSFQCDVYVTRRSPRAQEDVKNIQGLKAYTSEPRYPRTRRVGQRSRAYKGYNDVQVGQLPSQRHRKKREEKKNETYSPKGV